MVPLIRSANKVGVSSATTSPASLFHGSNTEELSCRTSKMGCKHSKNSFIDVETERSKAECCEEERQDENKDNDPSPTLLRSPSSIEDGEIRPGSPKIRSILKKRLVSSFLVVRRPLCKTGIDNPDGSITKIGNKHNRSKDSKEGVVAGCCAGGVVVTFSNIEVREYNRIIGDHDCSAPLAIGWEYTRGDVETLDNVEMRKTKRECRSTSRGNVEALSKCEKHRVLTTIGGYSAYDIFLAERTRLLKERDEFFSPPALDEESS